MSRESLGPLGCISKDSPASKTAPDLALAFGGIRSLGRWRVVVWQVPQHDLRKRRPARAFRFEAPKCPETQEFSFFFGGSVPVLSLVYRDIKRKATILGDSGFDTLGQKNGSDKSSWACLGLGHCWESTIPTRHVPAKCFNKKTIIRKLCKQESPQDLHHG